ncbi:MT-A70 family protein [Oxytricha trifallax]|uniref:MT-A70 family protein n=1 Tax=Oxytricha trifallax TaxID=1172189 RepID=A0A073IAF9_9SPIT|nr:MT-A70 family protein [Oxytricha trifallax]
MVIQKKIQDEKRQDFIESPSDVLVKVLNGYQFIPIQQRVKKLIYKLFREPLLYEGHVKDLRMWEQIAKDAIDKFGKLYEVVHIDSPWKIKQQVPYPTMIDQEILNMPINLDQERGILIFWIVNQKRMLPGNSLEKMAMTRSRKESELN